jgi:hypothetical protein
MTVLANDVATAYASGPAAAPQTDIRRTASRDDLLALDPGFVFENDF